MGIDLLDLKFRIEKSFGLELGREFFENVLDQHQPKWREPGQPRPDITVGQIHETLLSRLRQLNRLGTASDVVQSTNLQHVIDTLQLRFPDSHVTPPTLVSDLLTPPLDEHSWDELASLLHLTRPAIGLSPSTRVAYGAGCLNVFAAFIIMTCFQTNPGYLILSAAVLIPIGLWRASADQKSFPHAIRTVEDLANHALRERQSRPDSSWSAEWVWDELREIIVNTLGVDDDEVKPEARLVQDLGAD